MAKAASVRAPPGLDAAPPGSSAWERVESSEQWTRCRSELADLIAKMIAGLASDGAVGIGGGTKADTVVQVRLGASTPPGDIASTQDASSTSPSDTDEEVRALALATTLMVRNIPVGYTQEMIALEWPPSLGYDFLYLPRNAGGKANLGYAFVNFTDEAGAAAFRAAWHRRSLAMFRSARRLSCSLAEVQGFEANVRQLRSKPAGRLRSRHCQPLIVRDGRLMQLEEV